MLTKMIRFGVALHSLIHDFGRSRNLVIHHGLMGSSKNFRSISKTPAISVYVNSHLVDARNHGTLFLTKAAVRTQTLTPSRTWLMTFTSTFWQTIC
jgi:hypothetical protein